MYIQSRYFCSSVIPEAFLFHFEFKYVSIPDLHCHVIPLHSSVLSFICSINTMNIHSFMESLYIIIAQDCPVCTMSHQRLVCSKWCCFSTCSYIHLGCKLRCVKTVIAVMYQIESIERNGIIHLQRLLWYFTRRSSQAKVHLMYKNTKDIFWNFHKVHCQ